MIESKSAARFFLNRNVASMPASEVPSGAPLDFHRRLPGYAVTPLVRAPPLAEVLGVGAVWLKIESSRLGLPAFKILGASWAIHRALEKRDPALAPVRSLATATDGNHGRAVAHMANLLGLEARIYVPAATAAARIDGIVSEGAKVEIVNGTYDQAVERAARDASEQCLIISDTSWPGYEDVPRWVAEGYSTIFSEIDHQLARTEECGPDLVAIQFGVGALAAAAVAHYRATPTKILSVEPLPAACALASMEAEKIVEVPGPHDSIMAGLNCGRVSQIAWPAISTGIDAFIAIADERAREAMRLLAQCGIVAGETGAAGLAGLLELLTGSNMAAHRAALGIDADARVLCLITEGATDPESYAAIVR